MTYTLSEIRKSEDGDWTEHWACAPPEMHVRYRVLRQEWNDDFTVRVIHEIELVDE